MPQIKGLFLGLEIPVFMMVGPSFSPTTPSVATEPELAIVLDIGLFYISCENTDPRLLATDTKAVAGGYSQKKLRHPYRIVILSFRSVAITRPRLDSAFLTEPRQRRLTTPLPPRPIPTFLFLFVAATRASTPKAYHRGWS